MVRPMVHSIKHIVQQSLFTVAEGTTLNTTPVSATAERSSSPNVILQGSSVKAIFVEYWGMAESSQPSSFTITVEKLVGGAPNMTHAQALQLDDYPNKKNILYTTQGLIGDANTNPVPLLRNWVKIPKSKQRFGLGDNIKVNFTTIDPTASGGIEYCGVVIYKEYN